MLKSLEKLVDSALEKRFKKYARRILIDQKYYAKEIRQFWQPQKIIIVVEKLSN